MRSKIALLLLILAPLAWSQTADDWAPPIQEWSPPSAPAVAQPLAPREPCESRDPLRQAYFGDLHVHTAFSMDAQIRGAIATPDDAYRFARGEPLRLAPVDDAGEPTRTARLARPLDFAAVTDHAEWIGEVSLCTRPDSPTYALENCRLFRGEVRPSTRIGSVMGARMSGIASPDGRPAALCGPEDSRCRAEVASVWQHTQAAAERWYDRSARCSFTTFHAWEYSASPGNSKVHRNIILRNELAPELPISWLDEPSAEGLWRKLNERCNDAGTGCEALAIPHNPNLSNGQIFGIRYRGLPLEEQRAQARLRAQLEPLVEMMQAKGESECRSGMYQVVGDADELCEFEKVRVPAPPDCEEGMSAGALMGKGCQSRLDFVRYALIEGLRERDRIGVNPYRFGLIGSTDNHNGAPGDVVEAEYRGANGARDATLADRLGGNPGGTRVLPALRNPGGLMGVWAEENSRDALFDAMKRRETFATSGPRVTARMFGGWSFTPELCDRADLVTRGYADGVPMGALLPERADGAKAPTFVVSALRDPDGAWLQRIQIIKGWVGPEGRFHQGVHDVAGDAANGAGVDPETCAPRGPGADALCGVWRDPAFDPAQAAVYYARVLENPSCRWNAAQCADLAPADRPEGCTDPTLPRVIQERAWTSPIWYEPAPTP